MAGELLEDIDKMIEKIKIILNTGTSGYLKYNLC